VAPRRLRLVRDEPVLEPARAPEGPLSELQLRPTLEALRAAAVDRISALHDAYEQTAELRAIQAERLAACRRSRDLIERSRASRERRS
jgi:hypothetical protein